YDKAYDKGKELLLRCKAENVSADQHAMILGNLALVCFLLDKLEEAQGFYNKLFEVINQQEISGEFNELIALRNYGRLNLKQGNLSEAKTNITKSLLKESNRIVNSFQNAKSMLHLGEAQMLLGDYEIAQEYYTKAILMLDGVDATGQFSGKIYNSYVGVLIEALSIRGRHYFDCSQDSGRTT
ncbi:MAG: tetratricopeptide repeat protein, partial [Bacteroidota bacterium]|nr:tetratricopeptide repeat protein [Bacteroidota bacterium]